MSPRSRLLLLLSIAAVLTASGGGSTASPNLVSELVALQSGSPSGVIHLDDRSVARFLNSAPTPRPYSLLIFFDAKSLRDKPDLHLPLLRSEFALVSAAFAAHHAGAPTATKLFFWYIEFQESESSFTQFGVNSLPHVRHPPPRPLDSDPMDQSDFSRLADSMADFVVSKTGFAAGPIARPPPVSTKQIAFLILELLISSPFLIKRVLAGDTLFHDPKLYAALAVFV